MNRSEMHRYVLQEKNGKRLFAIKFFAIQSAFYFSKVGLWVLLVSMSIAVQAQDSSAVDTSMVSTPILSQADTDKTEGIPAVNNFEEQSPAISVPAGESRNSMWIPLILSLLALAGFVYLFFTKMDKQQAVNPADFYKKDFESAIQPLQASIAELKTQQKTLLEKLEQLQAEKLEAPAKVEEPAVVEVIEEDQVSGPIRTWYSVAPKNGIFFARQLAEKFKPREHIYRIEVLDEARAYYYLVDDNATRQHAFNIPDSYILPAMELDGNGRLAEASQIDIQRGSLIKAGNNWQIEEKAVLNYSV